MPIEWDGKSMNRLSSIIEREFDSSRERWSHFALRNRIFPGRPEFSAVGRKEDKAMVAAELPFRDANRKILTIRSPNSSGWGWMEIDEEIAGKILILELIP